jgi:hypothetical protein
MEKYYFGKSFTMQYTFEAGFAPIAENPSISIFSEIPTREEAINQAGTTKVGSTITAWTDANNIDNTKSFTVPAIADPKPTDNKLDDIYYVAIKYRIQSGADFQVIILPFTITRATGVISTPEVDPIHIKEIYPTIEEYIHDNQLTAFIKLAYNEIKRDLEKEEIDINTVVNQSVLHYPIALKAIALSCFSEFKDEGDKFYIRWQEFNKQYFKALNDLRVKADKDGNGSVDTVTTEKIFYKLNLN